MPVAMSAAPVPSRFTVREMSVSRVFRSIVATRAMLSVPLQRLKLGVQGKCPRRKSREASDSGTIAQGAVAADSLAPGHQVDALSPFRFDTTDSRTKTATPQTMAASARLKTYHETSPHGVPMW